MKIKRYLVDSLPDALNKIRLELGEDAIILNTKKIRTGGFLGLFTKEQVEVIAGVEREETVHKTTARAQSKPSGYNKLINQNGSAIRNDVRHSSSQPTAVEQNNRLHRAYKEQSIQVEKNDLLIQEIREMRHMFQQFVGKEGLQSLPIPLKQVYDRLLKQDVEEKIAFSVLKNVLEKYSSDLTEDEIYHLFHIEIASIIENGIMEPNQSTRFYHFVGPTGVGKTTTIAKLAAKFVLKQQKKVGLITSDTFRIAAIDQLKTYANILNLPLEVIFKADDLRDAVMRLAHNDIILMDTAGKNYRSQQYVDEIKALLNSSIPGETYLVMSLTLKYSDMVELQERFKEIGVDKVIFTKVDETNTYGSILNLTYNNHIKIAYLTNGQNVPDDILTPDPIEIAHLILGGKENV